MNRPGQLLGPRAATTQHNMHALPGAEAPTRLEVAVAHSILEVTWHLLTNGELYIDPGATYFERRLNPAVQAKRLSARIEALGFGVTLTEKVVA